MKAAVLKKAGKPLVIEEVGLPSVDINDVLVKIEAAEVSRSIVERVKGTNDMPIKTPIILGTGGAGTIVETGSRVSRVKLGDRVAINSLFSCGVCYNCGIGREDLCDELKLAGYQVDGTFAEYMAVPEGNVFPIPQSLSFEEAAIVPSTVGTPFSALRKAGVGSEDVLCVIGLGALGFVAAQLGKMKGARVIGVGRSADKLALAREVGVDETVDGDDDVPKLVKQLSWPKSGADWVFVTVGNAEVMENAIKCARKGGTVLIVADTRTPIRIKPMTLIAGVTLMGSMYFRRADIPELVRVIEEGRVTLKPLINGVYPMVRVNEAVEELERQGYRMNRLVIKP